MRKVETLILAEDLRQQNFARRYLICLGYNPRQIRQLPLPNGRGSGEQYVRESYALQIQAHRSQFNQRKGAILVVIDADQHTVIHRSRQLSAELQSAGQPPRSAGEMIVHLIPKRHIETWILCLAGQQVDEEDTYRNRQVDELIKPSAEELYSWCRPNFVLPDRCVPSLQAAIPELMQLDASA